MFNCFRLNNGALNYFFFVPQQTLYGNIDIGHVKTNRLDKPVKARYIRFIPVDWEGDMPCLRVEAYECIPRKGMEKERFLNLFFELIFVSSGKAAITVFFIRCLRDVPKTFNFIYL